MRTENYTPVEFLSKIQARKFKAATIPILMVVVSFVINYTLEIEYSKYFSIAGLLLYIVISMIYRVHKSIPLESDQQDILSPVHGKIVQIDENKIIIKKQLFDPIEIRLASTDTNIKISFKSKHINWLQENAQLPGKLIGFIPASTLCECEIPKDYNIIIASGDRVIAGETILAEK